VTKPDGRSDVPIERIESAILFIRGHKVMLDRDLAALYGVKTFNLNKAVKRNTDRFPEDFMFQLTAEEAGTLRFQIGMSKGKGRGGRRYLPYVFTEQGVAMLSSASEQTGGSGQRRNHAGFVRLRQMLASNEDLARKLAALEKKYDSQFRVVFEAMRELMAPPTPKKRKIGFLVKERAARYGRT
jgi:hypothetical protein